MGAGLPVLNAGPPGGTGLPVRNPELPEGVGLPVLIPETPEGVGLPVVNPDETLEGEGLLVLNPGPSGGAGLPVPNRFSPPLCDGNAAGSKGATATGGVELSPPLPPALHSWTTAIAAEGAAAAARTAEAAAPDSKLPP